MAQHRLGGVESRRLALMPDQEGGTRSTALVRSAAVVAVSPQLETNVCKTAHLGLPLVLSMARLIVIAFAVVLIRLTWRRSVMG